MKQLLIIVFMILLSNLSFGQASGNINYQNLVSYSNNNLDVNFFSNSMILSVKGLSNVKADSYVAIFSTSQFGKTTKEVTELIDTRINQGLKKIRKNPDVKTFVDMISFVPTYEYNVEKKLFSKKTYNEIPTGFELKKNIHIEYKDPNFLNEIIYILSNEEIYDLVRVDYFSTKLESIKKELRDKAKQMLQEKLFDYESILSKNLDSLSLKNSIVDGFKVVLPVEMYKSYQSFSSSSLNLNKSAKIKNVTKSTTMYYQPLMDKEFDFVINPIILEPVIQVMYQIKLSIEIVKERKVNKEYILITPNGDLKSINLE